MRIIEALADLVDRFFVLVDRVRRSAFRLIAAPVVFTLIAAIAALYAVGLWDFTFIKRPALPERHAVETEARQGGEGDGTPASPTPADTASPDEGETQNGDPAPDAKIWIGQMSDLAADGWYVTSKTFDPAAHRLAVLNVNVGAPAAYSVRERNVYKEQIVDSSEYVYGEKEVKVELVAESRPSLEAYGGFLFADNGESVVIFDCYGKYVGMLNEMMYFAYTRDRAGNPLFYMPATMTIHDDEDVLTETIETKNYYALTPNGIVNSDYRDEVYSRGVHADLPASYGAQTEPYPRSVIVNFITHLDLKNKLTGWTRTIWGYSNGYNDPFTVGWYDPAKRAEEAAKAEEEYQKALAEAEKNGEKPPKRESEKLTARERWEAAKEAAKLWDETPTTAFNFSEGLACVANDKKQMWFIDHTGKSVIELKDVDGFNSVGRPVVDNYYLPLTNGIESLGCYYFDHGLVRVRRQSYDKGQDNVYHMLRPEFDDDELIYADGTRFTLAEGYDVISYSDGMILLRSGGGRYGYMDYTGAWIVQPELDDAKPFVEGLAPIFRGGKWGVIDTSGDVVIPLAYDNVQTTSSGLIVCHREGGWTVFAKMALA